MCYGSGCLHENRYTGECEYEYSNLPDSCYYFSTQNQTSEEEVEFYAERVGIHRYCPRCEDNDSRGYLDDNLKCQRCKYPFTKSRLLEHYREQLADLETDVSFIRDVLIPSL